jgi:predicted transcriptional regulator
VWDNQLRGFNDLLAIKEDIYINRARGIRFVKCPAQFALNTLSECK